MGRVLQLTANDELQRRQQQSSANGFSVAAPARAEKSVSEVQSLFFDAGYCFAAIHNAQEARRCFERANEAELVQSLLECGGEDDQVCCACLDKLAETTLMPCEHVCLCKSCAVDVMESLGTCPLCRAACEVVKCTETQRTVWSAQLKQVQPMPDRAERSVSPPLAESDEVIAQRLQAQFDAEAHA